MKQKLILMIGLPGSGKSTKGLQVAEDSDFAYVSRDSVRKFIDLGTTKAEQKIIKKVFMGLIEAALLRGDTVVADATHLTEGSRAPLLELGEKYGAENLALVMNTSYETCILRNNEREGEDFVPTKVIRNMAQSMKQPEKKEGFKAIYNYNEGEDYKWNK